MIEDRSRAYYMTGGFDVNKAEALLGSSQELKMHWSGLIVNVMYFTIVALVAVWTLFIQFHLGDFKEAHVWNHAYLVLASTISILLLALWRWYTKYLDANIAHLYPELIYFEGKLSCPSQYGTSAYLKRNLGSAGDRLNEITDVEQKAEVVAHLVKKNLIGDRGHLTINLIAFGVNVLAFIIVFGFGIFECLPIGGGVPESVVLRAELKWLCGIFSVGGTIGMMALLFTWPRKPCELQIQEIITKVTKHTEDKPQDK